MSQTIISFTFIYTVTMFNITGDGANSIKERRCIAWWPNEEMARQCVIENWCDCWEDNTFNYAVIEMQPYGEYAIGTTEIQWYRMYGNTIYLIEKPDFLANIVGFGIG